MQHIAEIKQDTSFKPRLIMACLAVALLVSAIYVTVSYRLTADIAIQSELNAMETAINILDRELEKSNGDKSTFNSLAELLSNVDHSAKLFIVTNPSTSWQRSYGLDNLTISKLNSAISQSGNDNTIPLKLEGNTYLWQRIQGNENLITYVQQTTAHEVTLSFVTKRLLITSVIVFWIAVWLALTLSSLIAKRAQTINETLAQIATHDQLTGLPNRLYLIETLETVIDEHSKSLVNEGCLLLIDLNNFKEVNDSFGYAAGDILLQEVAKRLSGLIQSPSVVIRTGGDEFVIWAPETNLDTAQHLANDIVNLCNEPIMIHGLTVNSGASIGIAHYPTQTTKADGLIVCADTAMHKAKDRRSGWELFDEQNIADYKDILQLRAELSDAISHAQIVLYYQPKVDLLSGHIIGVEGLCRWHHPQRGVLGPGQFIDVIERSGKVQEFGRYIINRAISQIARWQTIHIDIPIAVNLSPYNLLDPGLVDFIRHTLEVYQVAPDNLEIELTENATSLNIDYIKKVLDDIGELGVNLAIDDFGTGMSSLAYLSALNVNVLKIDRTFITDIDSNIGHRAIIASAITLSDTFGCKMVAEGVETRQQAGMLLEMGCHIAQGYLFARPMPVNEIEAILKQQRPLYNYEESLTEML